MLHPFHNLFALPPFLILSLVSLLSSSLSLSSSSQTSPFSLWCLVSVIARLFSLFILFSRFYPPAPFSLYFYVCSISLSNAFNSLFFFLSILSPQAIITSFTPPLPSHFHPPQTYTQLASLKSPSLPRLPLAFIYISILFASPHHSLTSVSPRHSFLPRFLPSPSPSSFFPHVPPLLFFISPWLNLNSFFTSLCKLLTLSIPLLFLIQPSLSYHLIITYPSFSNFFFYHILYIDILLLHINTSAKKANQYVFEVCLHH